MTDFDSRFDQPDASIGLSFMRAYNLWHRRVKSELRPFSITHPQFVVLASLGHLSQANDEVTQRDLSEHSGIDVMTVSTIVRNLERSGLVVREVSVGDTRAKSVRLTKDGEERMNQALPVVERVDREFFGPLGQREHRLNAMLLELIGRADA